MNNRGFSDYEKYLLVSEHSKWALGTYPNFLKLKEVMSTLNQMVSKITILILIMEKSMFQI